MGDRVWVWCFFIVLFVCTGKAMAMSTYFVGWRTISQPDWSASLPEIASRCLNFLSQKASSSDYEISVPLLLWNICILCWKTPNFSTSQLACIPTWWLHPAHRPRFSHTRLWVDEHRTLGENALSCHEQLPFLRPGGLCGLCHKSPLLGPNLYRSGVWFEGFCISYWKIGDIPTIVYVGKYRKGSTKSGKDVHIPTQLKGMFELMLFRSSYFFWDMLV